VRSEGFFLFPCPVRI